MISRRGVLGFIACAPAIVRVGSLMAVRPLLQLETWESLGEFDWPVSQMNALAKLSVDEISDFNDLWGVGHRAGPVAFRTSIPACLWRPLVTFEKFSG